MSTRKAQIVRVLRNRYKVGFMQSRKQWTLIRIGVASKGEPRIVETPCPQFAERLLIW